MRPHVIRAPTLILNGAAERLYREAIDRFARTRLRPERARWPGGTTDPEYASFTDPKGPSGAEASWAFLRRYRRSDTAMPCAEAPASVNAR